MGGIKAIEVLDNECGEWEPGNADSMNDGFGELIASVVVVVGGIFSIRIKGKRCS